MGLIFELSTKELKWLFIIGFNQVLVALILFIRSNLSALLLFKKDSILSITDRLILIFFCGYFLYIIANNTIVTIDFFILSQTFAYLITVLLGFSFFNKTYPITKAKVGPTIF